jgi:hypothetical protein
MWSKTWTTMPREGAIIFSDLIGKLDMLRMPWGQHTGGINGQHCNRAGLVPQVPGQR